MALSIEPSFIQSIDDRVVFKYASEGSYTNYVYVYVYEGTSSATTIFSGTYYKFNNALYNIDITSILENTVYAYENFNNDIFTNNLYRYNIKVVEQINTTGYTNDTFSGYISYEYKNDYNTSKKFKNKYKEVSGVTFSTTALSNTYKDSFNVVGDYENIYLNFQTSGSSLVCSFFSSTFTRLATATATTFTSSLNFINYNLIDLRLTNQANYDACKYISVYSPYNNTSLVFDMHNCDILKYNNYNPIILYYINRLGGVDYQLFKMKYNKTQDIVNKTYNSNVSNVNIKKKLNIEITEKYILNTDYLSETDYNKLEELISSPVIFMQNTTSLLETNYIRVNITDTNFTYKEIIKDKLCQLQINIEYSTKNYRK